MDPMEDSSGPFHCLICLDLVHKPVVNACGHMFCFWCIHHAMNISAESYCPLCRRQYMHFPRVCELLHFFLLKAVPDEYRRRCMEVYEVELETMYFSPQFDDGVRFDKSGEQSSSISSAAVPRLCSTAAVGSSGAEHSSPGEDAEATAAKVNDDCLGSSCTQLVECTRESTQAGYAGASTGAKKLSSLRCAEEPIRRCSRNIHNSVDKSSGKLVRDCMEDGKRESPGLYPNVCASDLPCLKCNKLLYQPVVLNCGHVFCEACVLNCGVDAELRCPTCGSLHPGAFPHICLELHYFLESCCPLEYNHRKFEIMMQAADLKTIKDNLPNAKAVNLSNEKKNGCTGLLHARFGCDGCGMYPLMGLRFHCTVCVTPPGYDLCWYCHTNETSLLGRFNQQHTKEHQMVEVKPLLAGDSDDDRTEQGEGDAEMEPYYGFIGYFA